MSAMRKPWHYSLSRLDFEDDGESDGGEHPSGNDMDGIHIKGFLSSEIEAQQKLAREQYASEFHACEQWSDRAVALIATMGADQANIAKFFAIGYWMRCVRACQGAIILCERGMIPDALTLLRSAVESLFHTVALLNEPQLWERLVEHDMSERVKNARGILNVQTIMGNATDSDRQKLEALRARESEKLRSFPVYDAARVAGLVELYETMFRGFSRDGAHSTVSALEHEFSVEADGSFSPSFGPYYADVEWALEMIAECLRIGIGRIGDRLQSGV